MGLSLELIGMTADLAKPRHLGAFVLAIEPSAFVEAAVFNATMTRYLNALRSSPAMEGRTVMAPGDREWAEFDRRARAGIPLDPETQAAFARLAQRLKLKPLTEIPA
jgi:LDH2 family malate/lactate/ureidoglycolate dehydrogenase